MNLAKIIAKFMKLGLAELTPAEKSLLSDNASLMSPDQKSQFEKAVEDAKEEEGAEDEDDEEGADEPKPEKVDQKGLRSVLAKMAQEEIQKSVNGISDQLVEKFVAGVKEGRTKVLNGAKPAEDKTKNVTRDFFKALVSNDSAKLKEFKAKATHFNEEADDARGGYLIPEELRSEVLRIAETSYGVARRNMLYLPFTGAGNSRKIPTLASSVTVTWTGEAVKKTGTNPTFGVVEQTLKKLAAIVPFTEELLEDSAVNVTQLVAALFAEAVAKEEDIQFFRGTGSPWTGILNNGSVNKVNLATSKKMADVTADDLLTMIDDTPAGALAGAKFYLHRHALSYVRKLKDENGQPVFQRAGEGLPSTIWDYPYELVEAFPDKTQGAVAATGIIGFGNLKIAAVFGDKQQIRAKVLTEATITDADGTTPINLAEQDMIALRLEERVGYVVSMPTAFTVLKTGPASS